MKAPSSFLFLLLSLIVLSRASGQNPLTAVSKAQPNLVENADRPLRYTPDGRDFVIENGGEFFNRPLYGGNTAFRVDAGDQPEFSLYLPGHGGNLRFGIKTPRGAKWLHETARITARYRPGTMLYEIRDPLLGAGAVLHLHAIALHQTDGLIVRIEAHGLTAPVELIAAYGGLDGRRGARDGDIGTEAVPIGQYFQLKPASCQDNEFALGTPSGAFSFTLQTKPATIAGLMPPGATLALADATQWTSLGALLASAAPKPSLAVMTARIAMPPSAKPTPLYFALQRIPDPAAPANAEELATYRNVTADRPGLDRKAALIPLAPAYRSGDLPRIFAEAEEHFRALRAQIVVETPDPFINAAVAALNVGVDAVWDESQGVVMHGAVAWRSKLLGWRGPYAPDALGWHDRARRHFAYWATRQNTDPIPEKLPPPDENSNLARSEAALHSNGDISNSHYDMNTVYIDALFRHFHWTGDLDFARKMWPVIERHLTWERRLFRREYGPGKLPLYEAYAVIWASDDLQYHGGGATHSSAYNYYHNTQAARLARLLGKDAAPYEKEAALVARAMREFLWMPDRGMFAEFRDYLGLQRLHPSAALWSFYHTMDADLVTPAEAYKMTEYVDTCMPHFPVRGRGVPTDDTYHVLSTTDWMPYSWSINNVVMGENIHTALGFWQAGRAGEAFRIAKSALLASMFMGICPGNVGTLNYLDVYRREAQRDFADGGGVTSRAIVEGLFGLRPDALAGELLIAPGLPAEWDHASLRHPDASIAFKRNGATDTYVIEQRLPKPLPLRLQLPTRGDLRIVTIDGRAVGARPIPNSEPSSRFEIQSPAAQKYQVVIQWKSAAQPTPARVRLAPASTPRTPPRDWNMKITGTTAAVELTPHFNDRVTQIFKNEYRSPRSPFVSLAIPKQGIGAWAGHVNATAGIDDTGLRAAARAGHNRITLPNGVPLATPGESEARNVVFVSQWDNYPREVTVPLSGKSRGIVFLMAGSTNHMQRRFENGEVVVTYADGSGERLVLENPTNWWPIDQDYFIDDFQFRRPEPIPMRVNLKTGEIRVLDIAEFKGRGGSVPGGAATVLDLPLESGKELKSLTVRAIANEVVIGLMAATLVR
ncbi:MAG: DUF4450 domain-containing protein [Bryobacteraceae bacterium]|jgi:hypothetical protein